MKIGIRLIASSVLAFACGIYCSRAQGASVLVSDAASANPKNRILAFSAETGAFERVVVDGNAGLVYPSGMAMHPTRGTLLVASFGTNSVMEFDLATGSKLAEFGGQQLLAPTSIKVHPTRNTLLVSGRDNQAILEYSLADGSYLGAFAQGPALNTPFGFDFDLRNQTMLVSNYGVSDGSIVKFDLNTGSFLGNYPGVIEATDLLIHPLTGDALVDSGNLIAKVNPVNGAYLGTFASNVSLDFPSALGWLPDSNDLLVVSRGNRQLVARFDGVTGQFESVFIPFNTAGMDGPQAVLVIPEPSSMVALAASAVALVRRRRAS